MFLSKSYLTLPSYALCNRFELVLYCNLCYYLWVPYKFCNPVKLNFRCLPPLTVCKQLMLSQSDIKFYRWDKSIKVYFHIFMFLFHSYLTLFSCALYNRFKLVLYLYCNFCHQLWVPYKFCNPVKLNSR